MEPTQLQLVLNVVMITGVATLGGYCYLLKKENRKLAAQSRPAEVRASAPAASQEPASSALSEQDIRKFAAGRRSGWVKNLASSIR